MLIYFSVLFYLWDRDNLSTRDKIVAPKVSLVQRFHYIIEVKYSETSEYGDIDIEVSLIQK